ncbi:MAG: redoxin family protein [Bacteroidales bacterium]|nr:redoxin family protein [Bacteroidales bacterium]
MKRLIIIIGVFVFTVSAFCQTDKEIDNIVQLINSEEYKYQDSIIWIELRPLKAKSDSLEKLGKKAFKSGDKNKAQDLMTQYIKCTKEKLDVLSNHPDFVYSADYLLLLAMREKDEKRREPKIGSLSDYKNVYDSFSKDVKASYFGKGLKMLFDSDIPKIGEIAPNMTFYTDKGKEVTLSDYKGRCVLLKSYFNECGGWSIDKSKINEIYPKLDTSKIVVIAIGIGNDKKNWVDDVNKNNFPWISVFQPIGGEMTITYNIKSNSRSVLIDPDGKIVDMDIDIQNGGLLTGIEKHLNK